MSDEQFTAFSVFLAAISVLSVSGMFLLVWDLWQYGSGQASGNSGVIETQ